MRTRVNIKAQMRRKIAVLRGFCVEVEGFIEQRKRTRKSGATKVKKREEESKMGNEIKVTMRKLAELVPYENNPRDNSKAVNAVAESIKEFGFKNPIIVDKNGCIVAGHTRLKAAEKLGLDEVPVIVADDLSDEQVKAFRLADNKTAELAEWNFELLETELAGISEIDMSAFGFDIDADSDEAEATEDNYSEPDDLPEIAKFGGVLQFRKP